MDDEPLIVITGTISQVRRALSQLGVSEELVNSCVHRDWFALLVRMLKGDIQTPPEASALRVDLSMGTVTDLNVASGKVTIVYDRVATTYDLDAIFRQHPELLRTGAPVRVADNAFLRSALPVDMKPRSATVENGEIVTICIDLASRLDDDEILDQE